MSHVEQFRALHTAGTFVIPNPWDVGSARLLEHFGAPALATTSAGFAASLGRLDQQVSRDELVAHTASLAEAVGIPVHVDAEDCFPRSPGGVARTVELLAAAGAAGCSIEDHDPVEERIVPIDLAVERVGEAVAAARPAGLVVTARAENHLHGRDDLDDTVARLRAYADAGAEVVYAPGLHALDDIARVVREVGRPVNVLALPGVPSVADLAAVGVRRVSTGGGLALTAYGALAAAARELLGDGTWTYLAVALPRGDREAAFAPRPADPTRQR